MTYPSTYSIIYISQDQLQKINYFFEKASFTLQVFL